VINEDTGDVVTVLSALDLVSYIVEKFPEEDFVKLKERSSEVWQSFYGKMIGTKNQIVNERIDHLLEKRLFDFETIDPVYSVYGTFPLQTAVELMVGSRAHRVVVLDERGRFSNFISQARLLELLLPVMSGLPELSRPLIELGLWEKAIKDVAIIHESDMAYRAFKRMKEKRLSGLAVVNSEGVIVGNISVSDLKLLEFDMIFFNLLGNSVKEYLRLVSSPELLYERPIRFRPLREALSLLPRPVVTCKLSDSLGYIMAILNHYNIHRVYVVDDKEKPIGVVSLHDVLSHIMDTRRTTEAL
jgi:CBS domain-containing protein